MKRFFTFVIAVSFVFSIAGFAIAQMSGKTVEWDVKDQGNVTFSGKAHADAGLKCNDCHTKIFKMKKSEHKMDDIKAGKECGVCHNGKKAFGPTDDNCVKCHKK